MERKADVLINNVSINQRPPPGSSFNKSLLSTKYLSQDIRQLRNAGKMQAYPSAAGPPVTRHTGASSWQASVQALTAEGNQPAFTLLSTLAFVQADITIPNLGLNAPGEVSARFSRLRGLKTKAEFDNAMGTLQRHKLISKDDELPARSIDASLQSAIYATIFGQGEARRFQRCRVQLVLSVHMSAAS